MANYIQIDEKFWDEIKDGENIVIYHNGEEKDIVVPEELGGHPVTRIGKLKPTDEVESITIPRTVTVIEDDAFDGFPKDFVIYCYPETKYTNKDGYKIIFLEDEVIEEGAQKEIPVEEVNETEESTETVEEASNIEESVETVIEVEPTPPSQPTTNNSNTILGAIIFVTALVLLLVSFILKGKK